jgi:putative ABC transport system substrate-binding protein
MKRRVFVLAAGAWAGSAALTSNAQRAAAMPVVAFVAGTPAAAELAGPEPRNDYARAFLQRMRELGWEHGRNILIERHSAEGRPERARAIFADLAARKAAVIVTAGNVGTENMADEARNATRAIPIVFVGGGSDPVARGLVASLSRPGGNVTGFLVNIGFEFFLKRLEVLKEIAPGIKRVAVLGPVLDLGPNATEIQAGLRKLGISLVLAQADKAEDFAAAFAGAVRAQADAVYVTNVSLNRLNAPRIIALAAKHRLPAEYFFRESVEAGGLASYGVDLLELARRSAGYVDRILRGARPADLPIELPSKFELTINLKTAKALGLAIPRSLLLRADRVIE